MTKQPPAGTSTPIRTLVALLAALGALGTGLGACLPVTHDEAMKWLEAQAGPTTLDVSGSWVSREWGATELRQSGNQVTGTAGRYEVKGRIKGQVVHLVLGGRDTFSYSARLTHGRDPATGAATLSGSWFYGIPGPNDTGRATSFTRPGARVTPPPAREAPRAGCTLSPAEIRQRQAQYRKARADDLISEEDFQKKMEELERQQRDCAR